MTFSGFGQNNPVFSKVTATWCPNCGNWGWDYMETMKDEFASGPATILGVHYSGDLANETAVWFADNLNSVGQPVFYLNNTKVAVGSSNWSDQVESTKDMATEAITSGLDIISFDGITMGNGQINATINIREMPNTTNEVYAAVYVYENNVENNQSGNGLSLHPNVLRSALGPTAITIDNDGVLFGAPSDLTFLGVIQSEWVENELGLLAVVYEKVGETYEIRSSQSVSNIALTLDAEELLAQDIFTFKDGADNLEILVNDDADYQLTLHNMGGQTLMTKQFNNSVNIDKTNLTTGMYIANFRSGNAVLSQQVFIR